MDSFDLATRLGWSKICLAVAFLFGAVWLISNVAPALTDEEMALLNSEKPAFPRNTYLGNIASYIIDSCATNATYLTGVKASSIFR